MDHLDRPDPPGPRPAGALADDPRGHGQRPEQARGADARRRAPRARRGPTRRARAAPTPASAPGGRAAAMPTPGSAEEWTENVRMRRRPGTGGVGAQDQPLTSGNQWQTSRRRKRSAEQRELPDRDAAREWLEAMMLIRRFEERAGEMYAKAKVGGFLHLAIGEEATIVGAVRAMRDEDYLISTYRSHGHALSRGADPNKVMAELFGREDGVSQGPRRLDAHVRPRAPLHGRLRDRRRQPPAGRRDGALLRLPRDRGGHGVRVRRRRLEPGHVRRDAQPRRAVGPARRLHGHQQPVRDGHLARAPLRASPTCTGAARASACPACAATAWTCSTPTR